MAYDGRGFDENGIHRGTGTKYDSKGYDDMIDEDLIKKEYTEIRELPMISTDIVNWVMVKMVGMHKVLTAEAFIQCMGQMVLIDMALIQRATIGKAYDNDGYDRKEFNKYGYDRDGYDRQGFNKNGFNRGRIHRDTGTKYNLEGYNEHGFDEAGYDKDGFNELGYNRAGVDRLGIDKNGKDVTGKDDERVLFVRKFINAGITIPQYAKQKDIPVEILQAQIDAYRDIACTKAELDKVLKQNANRYVGAKMTEKDKLIAGKIRVQDVVDIDKTISFCNIEEREVALKLLSDAMASHRISIMEYRSMFALGKTSSILPSSIISKVERYNSEMKRAQDPKIRKNVKGVYDEIRRLEGYKKPYRVGDLKRIGYTSNDGKEIMVDVTMKNIELAKEYLTISNEFICYKTMATTLMQIAKGEITIESIKSNGEHTVSEILEGLGSVRQGTLETTMNEIVATSEKTKDETPSVGEE